MKHLGLAYAAVISLSGPAPAAAQASDFNLYILKAVTLLSERYPHGGYDLGKAFTHDLAYGGATVAKSSSAAPPAPTMCVAAAAEVIITAIALYAQETGDTSVFTKIPAALWQRGNVLSLRANIFMFKGTGSRGTAHTLERFGMGRQTAFDKLKPGDFVNLNRTSGSGHAVVFMGYLDAAGKDLAAHGPAVKGFRYFSAQGKGRPDAGFAFRNAYFSGTCPANAPGKVRDCNVILSANPVLLNVGRMSAPGAWRVAEAIAALRNTTSRAISDTTPGITRAAIDAELDRDLPPEVDGRLDGVADDGSGQ